MESSAWATGLKGSVWDVLDLEAVESDTMDLAATNCCAETVTLGLWGLATRNQSLETT